MKLILISSETTIKNETKIMNALFKSGLEYFHLRKPFLTLQELRIYLDKINPFYHSKIVIHQHYELIKEYQLKGVHYKSGKWNLFRETASFQQSASFHSENDLKLNSQDFDYRFISPIFNSISKVQYPAKLIPAEFLRLNHLYTNLVALGGVTLEKFNKISEMEFKSIAVCGTIWQEASFTKIVKKFKEMDKIYC